MANALYAKGREAFLNAGINWTSGNIKAALVKTAYTPDLANHQFYSDLTPASNVVGTPQALASKGTTAGVASATDVTFTTVASGSTIGYIAIYLDTGVAGTSPLIALIDTVASGAVNISTNGGDITIQWDTGTNKIFKL